MLSIFLNHLINSASARVLGWWFYNFKSSILNKLANLFRKITIKSLLQWFQNLVLNKTLVTILKPIPSESNMSSLAPKAQPWNQMSVATRLLPLLRYLLYYLISPLKTSSWNSQRHLWNQPRLKTGSKQSLENNYLRIDLWKLIQENLI